LNLVAAQLGHDVHSAEGAAPDAWGDMPRPDDICRIERKKGKYRQRPKRGAMSGAGTLRTA